MTDNRAGRKRKWRSWDRYRRRKQTVGAAELVSAVLARNGIVRDVREHRVMIEWPDIVGGRIARRTWPERVEGRTLWVAVESSPWLAELSFMAADMAQRVNRHVGEPPLCDEVKLTLAGRGQRALAPARRPRPQPSQKPLSPASERDLAAITREASGIEDPELRDIIIAARRKIGL